MKPLFEHDCDACVFLGTWRKNPDCDNQEDFDLYVCEAFTNLSSINCLARFGNDGPDYASMTLENSVWDASLAAHDAGKERPSMYLCWVPELLECWRRAKMHTFHPNPDYKMGPVTGRISCAEPNMENIPVKSEEGARIRNAISPNVLVQAAESDTVARYIQALRDGSDVHKMMAAAVFGKEEGEVTPEERKEARDASYLAAYAIHDRVAFMEMNMPPSIMDWKHDPSRDAAQAPSEGQPVNPHRLMLAKVLREIDTFHQGKRLPTVSADDVLEELAESIHEYLRGEPK